VSLLPSTSQSQLETSQSQFEASQPQLNTSLSEVSTHLGSMLTSLAGQSQSSILAPYTSVTNSVTLLYIPPTAQIFSGPPPLIPTGSRYSPFYPT